MTTVLDPGQQLVAALVSPDNRSVLGGGEQSLRSFPLLRANLPPVLTGKGSSGFALTCASSGRASRHAVRMSTSGNHTRVTLSVPGMGQPVELTAEHIELMERVAGRMAKTQFGQLAGREELISEGLVILVELANSYDPERSPHFTDYLLSKIRFKFIDYLRGAYGRAMKVADDGSLVGANPRLRAAFRTYSLDAPALGHEDAEPRQMPMPGPSVEEQALARIDWDEFMDVVAGLDEVEQELLLWPVSDESTESLSRRVGLDRTVVAYERRMVKNVVSNALGREIYIQPKTRRKGREETETPVEISRDMIHDVDAEAEAQDGVPADGTTVGRIPSVAGQPDRVLAVDRSPGSRRIRKTRKAVRPPRRLGDAPRPDPQGAGTGSSVLREVLRPPGSPGAGDQGREHQASSAEGQRAPDLQERPREGSARAPELPGGAVLHGVQRGEQATTSAATTGGGQMRLTISDEDLLRRINNGETQTEIAREFGVYPGTVHYRLKHLGVTRNRMTETRKRLMPFKVPARDSGLYEIRMLRLLIAVIEGRKTVGPSNQAFRRFVRHCLAENVVLTYSEEEGCSYVPHDGPSDTHPYRSEVVERMLDLPALSSGRQCPTCLQAV